MSNVTSALSTVSQYPSFRRARQAIGEHPYVVGAIVTIGIIGTIVGTAAYLKSTRDTATLLSPPEPSQDVDAALDDGPTLALEQSPPGQSLTPVTNFTNRVNLPQPGRDFRQISNLFPEDRGEYFDSFFSSINTLSMEGMGGRVIHYAARNVSLYFSDSYQLENPTSVCPSNVGLSPILEEIIILSLSRFAQELKLQGKHIINCQISSYTPSSGTTLSQGWHFDVGAKETMIAVLQNDFSTVNPNAGLDMSLNTVDAVFNPFELSKDEEAIPKKCLSLSYPKNGALFVHGRQGKIIHRMSELAARTFTKEQPCKRTIIQIARRDENWCASWAAEHN